jgi:hypothetical protein
MPEQSARAKLVSPDAMKRAFLSSVIASLLVSAQAAHQYSKEVLSMGLRPALRLCLRRAGQQLSHAFVHALVASGKVSRAEVERRKRLGR